MLKTYAVVFQNQRTGKVAMDKFTGLNEGEARGSFWVCYRHENYKILATVEVPEIKKTEGGGVKMIRANGTRSAKIIQVIETKAERGLGVEKDPVREITQYWSLEGKFLAERDEDSQLLHDLVIWESKRLAKIIEDSTEN